MLRHNIWNHLTSLCDTGRTIIVTTHYIDEARKSRCVAFMRDGKILAEDNPENLLNRFGLNNLEDVFLKLCLRTTQSYVNLADLAVDIEKEHGFDNPAIDSSNPDEDNGLTMGLKRARSMTSLKVPNGMEMGVKKEDVPEITVTNDSDNVRFDNKSDDILLMIRDSRFTDKCAALLHNNFKRVTRHPAHLFFEVIVSSLMFMVVFVSMGDGPTNMKLAVFNEEEVNNVTNRWGHLFIDCIEKGRFEYYYYNSFNESYDSVKRGENHAVIDINERFTKALFLRFLYTSETNEDTLYESQIRVHIDRSNQVIALQVERYLYFAMMDFVQKMATKAEINPDSLKVPMAIEDPIYGNAKESMREFMIPGVYIIVAFFVSALITAHMIIEERQGGILERSLVAGIAAPEFLAANLITQFFIQCLQLSFLLLVPHIIMDGQIPGSFILFVAMLFSQGFCGVGLGLLLSTLISDLIIAALAIVFLFLTSIVTSGTLWPIENMPYVMQHLCKLFPSTIPVQALRCIVYRDWGLEHFEVVFGFIVTYIWIIIFLVISLFLLKRKL